MKFCFGILPSKVTIFLISVIISASPFKGFTLIFKSVLDGNWSSTTTWNQYLGGSWGSTSNIPAYGDIVTIQNNVNLDITLPTGVDHGFLILRIDSSVTLSASSSVLTVGNGDYVSIAGSITLGGISLKSGGIFLVKANGSAVVNASASDNASSSMIINGSLSISSPATIENSGIIYGSGAVTADTYSGGGSVFGEVKAAGALEAYGFTWTGPSNGSWFNSLNWSESTKLGRSTGFTPNDTLRVTIPAGIGNVVLDDNAVTATAYSVKIKSGSSLIINPQSKLSIISEINNFAGTGGLHIKSDAVSTGSLILPESSVSLPSSSKPDATVRLHITGNASLGAMMYHFVSVPMEPSASNQSSLFMGSYLFHFDVTSNNWVNLGPSTTTQLDATRGYMIYYPGASIVYDITGKLNNGKFTALTTNAGSGYNLVPNPYSSAIDWTHSGIIKTNIGGTIYIWPAGAASASENYASFNQSSGGLNGGRKEIAMGQSFIVQVTGVNPELSFTNGACTHVIPPFLKSNEGFTNLIRLKTLAGSNNTSDELIVHFLENATTGFDAEFDGNKFQGGIDAPQFCSVDPGSNELSINCLPFFSGEIIVPLKFSFSQNSNISLTAGGMNSFPPHVGIYLEDQESNKVMNLRKDSVYTFGFQTGIAEDRLRLRFSGAIGTDELRYEKGRAFENNGYLFLDLPGMQDAHTCVRVFSVTGQLLSSEYIEMKGIERIKAPAAPGIYIIEASSGEQRFVSKIMVRRAN